MILQGDCLEVMKDIPDKSIDMVLTSPPYDNLRDYKGYTFDFEGIAKELYRITKQGGVVVWVVGDSVIDGNETGTSFKQALYFKEIGFNLYDTMIYEKNGTRYPEQKRYYQCFEYMFIFSKGIPKTINLIRDRKNKWQGIWGKRTTRKKDGTLLQKEAVPYVEFGIRYNIWRMNCGFGHTTKDKFAYEHPAMFPEKLAADHIRSWSNEGDLILDPMNGSGTTTKMAKILKRNYIGIEISPEYCEIARQRLRQEILI
jgi:site-specific DNA-methyltransferase (adenine-specific)